MFTTIQKPTYTDIWSAGATNPRFGALRAWIFQSAEGASTLSKAYWKLDRQYYIRKILQKSQ